MANSDVEKLVLAEVMAEFQETRHLDAVEVVNFKRGLFDRVYDAMVMRESFTLYLGRIHAKASLTDGGEVRGEALSIYDTLEFNPSSVSIEGSSLVIKGYHLSDSNLRTSFRATRLLTTYSISIEKNGRAHIEMSGKNIL
ncbi:hypothetical protein CR969_01165 [Candidatus Saccharibacteria bacterium]|nr:MAG: hypothetical protein CR969_01165 [Candidatus Saccharibacteria bacterium]